MEVRGVVTTKKDIIGAYLTRAQALCEKIEPTYDDGRISKLKFLGIDSSFEFEFAPESKRVAITYCAY